MKVMSRKCLNSCNSAVDFLIISICGLVFSRFGFDDSILVLIAHVLGHCLHFNF